MGELSAFILFVEDYLWEEGFQNLRLESYGSETTAMSEIDSYLSHIFFFFFLKKENTNSWIIMPVKPVKATDRQITI